jgi:peptidoglycan hydrolase CwlO-like protein
MKTMVMIAAAMLLVGCSESSDEDTIGKQIADDYNEAMEKARKVEDELKEHAENIERAVEDAMDEVDDTLKEVEDAIDDAVD